MEQEFSSSYLDSLQTAVCKALRDSLSDTAHEPQLVANLVWELPRHINNISSTSGLKVAAGGIFVHSQPCVTCEGFPEKNPVLPQFAIYY